ADGVIVSDSHGNGQSLLLDDLPDRVEVVRNWPRPLGMMQGVDAPGVEAAFLLGYHTGAHHAAGVLAHTSSGLLISQLRLNGAPASETTISAAIAGHFGVPVIFASGDDAYVEYAREALGDGVETVCTKISSGRYSARTLTPAASCALIRTAAEKAVAGRGAAAPVRVEPPIRFEADFQRHIPAELLDYLPGVERTGSNTVEFNAPDMVAVSKFLSFFTAVKFDEQLP
ncbi:MAG: M55 family metallopeptidase, partial [Pseudomonadota bacterium]